MKKTVFILVLNLTSLFLNSQTSKFIVPDSCTNADTPYELSRCGNHYYHKSKYSQALGYFEKAYLVEPTPQLLINIYNASEGSVIPFDKARFLRSEKYDELLFYVKNLNFGGGWVLAYEICEKAIQINPAIEAKLLLHNVSMMGKLPFDMRLITELDDPKELIKSADYCLNTIRDKSTAQMLYERSEKLKHSSEAILGLYELARLENKPFDQNLFFKWENSSELFQYSYYFFNLAAQKTKNKDKVPDYQQGVLLFEEAVKLAGGKNYQRSLASNYSNLAFYLLFVTDPKSSETFAQKAIQADPSFVLSHTNLAPALLLQGKYQKAEMEYLKWKDQPLRGAQQEEIMEDISATESAAKSPKTFRDAFLQDLNELEREGITHPDFNKIRVLLEK